MFLHGGVVIVQVFPHTIVDKAYSAPDVVLVAVVACDLVNSIAYQARFGAGDRAVGPRACPFFVVVREGSSESIRFVRHPNWYVLFSENACDPVV